MADERGAFIVLLDGYDLQAMALAVPALAREARARVRVPEVQREQLAGVVLAARVGLIGGCRPATGSPAPSWCG